MALVKVGGTAAAPTDETYQDVVAVSLRPFGTGTSAVDFTAKSVEFKFGDIGADYETEPTLAGGLMRKYKSREATEHTVKLYTIEPAEAEALINMGTIAAVPLSNTGTITYPTLERKNYRLSVLYSEENLGASAEAIIDEDKKAKRHVWRFVEVTKCTPLNEDKNLYGVELTFKTQPFTMAKPADDKTVSNYLTDLLEYTESWGSTHTATTALGDFDGTSG